MGGMHTKAVEQFFCDTSTAKSGGFAPFRKEAFFGKYDWEEEDARKIKLPNDMCDLSRLFET